MQNKYATEATEATEGTEGTEKKCPINAIKTNRFFSMGFLF